MGTLFGRKKYTELSEGMSSFSQPRKSSIQRSRQRDAVASGRIRNRAMRAPIVKNSPGGRAHHLCNSIRSSSIRCYALCLIQSQSVSKITQEALVETLLILLFLSCRRASTDSSRPRNAMIHILDLHTRSVINAGLRAYTIPTQQQKTPLLQSHRPSFPLFQHG